MATINNPDRTCHYCSKPSSSLLRCSQCKSAYYCNRACQSAAWGPNPDGSSSGHRTVCRRLRKRANLIAASSSQEIDGHVVANEAWRDLSQHVQSMDCDEAHRQMCMVQDEIKRLQSYCETNQSEVIASSSKVVEGSSSCFINENKSKEVSSVSCSDDQSKPTRDQPKTPITPKTSKQGRVISGSWLEDGNSCSIEFLPNIKCYLVTMKCKTTEKERFIPGSRDDLALIFSPIENNQGDVMPAEVTYYETKVYNASKDNDRPILSLMLPIDTFAETRDPPHYTTSLDNNCISIRIQLVQSADDSLSIVSELLGFDVSSFSWKTSDANALNSLCCRTCHNAILKNTSGSNQAIIKSVLPLPSGYWDEITDYLICYEGQPTVEFNSSSTSAIQGTVLEDDAIVILHRLDLSADSGVCELNVIGYGEYASASNIEFESTCAKTGSQPWKDKSLRADAEVKTIACAICCSTLGFVSSYDANTFRFYKHLLFCDNDKTGPRSNMFRKHTCSTFLAREMIRYAESDAIYTFIVETDGHTNSTRCMLLRMLSWDTIMKTFDSPNENQHSVNETQYQKVLKVIFEETSRDSFHLSSNNPMDWKWGNLDLCCPPRPVNSGTREVPKSSTEMEMLSNMNEQTKASSIRICLSPNEWNEVKHSLVNKSQYFSESVRDAVVMTKLGVLPGNEDDATSALLSFLTIIT